MEIATNFEAVNLLEHIVNLQVNPYLLILGYDNCQKKL